MYWDTETGAAIAQFTTGTTAYSAKLSPSDSNVMLVGGKDKKVVQWDIRSGKVTQEYNYHLGPVNTVTFVDNGRRFVSTSDDKKVLVWELNINVPIKYIQEPDMSTMPAVTLHPSGKYLLAQSMDKQIVTFETGERTRKISKSFKGHASAGFACEIACSPNGELVASGDGSGYLWFWNFRGCRILRKLKAHRGGPCISSAWHPLEPSRLATCGWDGDIKLWD